MKKLFTKNITTVLEITGKCQSHRQNVYFMSNCEGLRHATCHRPKKSRMSNECGYIIQLTIGDYFSNLTLPDLEIPNLQLNLFSPTGDWIFPIGDNMYNN